MFLVYKKVWSLRYPPVLWFEDDNSSTNGFRTLLSHHHSGSMEMYQVYDNTCFSGTGVSGVVKDCLFFHILWNISYSSGKTNSEIPLNDSFAIFLSFHYFPKMPLVNWTLFVENFHKHEHLVGLYVLSELQTWFTAKFLVFNVKTSFNPPNQIFMGISHASSEHI